VLLVVGVSWAVSAILGQGAGVVGLLLGLVVAGGTSAAAYWKSDAIALRASRAVPADPVEHARLHNLVEGLCIAAGLPKPRLYIVADPAPNAFATGRNPQHAAVAVTTGLLEKLNRVELEGVLAHELSHIKNYDILVSTLAVTLVGVITLMADFTIRSLWWGGGRRQGGNQGGGPAALLALVGFALLLLAPLLGRVMQAAVSRRRESLADISAASLTRYPPGLISALEKLRADRTVVRHASRATAHLWIEEPVATHLSARRQANLDRLFNTHPPMEERIAALREL
jgi:heat shock protein HtpX